MRTADTHDWRVLIFLIVLLFHAVVVFLATRAVRQGLFSSNSRDEPFVLLLLNDVQTPATTDTAMQHAPNSVRPSASGARRARRKRDESGAAITLPADVAPPQPKIDWIHEAEIAVRKEIARPQKEGQYRDLSALTPKQLSWIKQNHLEPVPRRITWNHPRVEIENGLPIIWINDHCVIIPPMLVMVFCVIGHIEARGDLFEHMHDPHDQH